VKEADLNLESPAKLNLSLEVIGILETGFHEISSIMQSLDLHDEITFYESSDLEISCSVPELADQNNLIFQVVSKLKTEYSVGRGVKIHVQKNIPLASGLGGGSSNIATVLGGLNLLWDLRLTNEELKRTGAIFGSDIPFFIQGGTAYSHGTGTEIRQLPDLATHAFLLIDPKCIIPNKTATMYSKIISSDYTNGGLTRKLEARIRGGGDVPQELMYNVFDKISSRNFNNVKRCIKTLKTIGIREIHTAGSGPYLFTVIKNKDIGRAYQILLQNKYAINSIVTESIGHFNV